MQISKILAVLGVVADVAIGQARGRGQVLKPDEKAVTEEQQAANDAKKEAEKKRKAATEAAETLIEYVKAEEPSEDEAPEDEEAKKTKAKTTADIIASIAESKASEASAPPPPTPSEDEEEAVLKFQADVAEKEKDIVDLVNEAEAAEKKAQDLQEIADIAAIPDNIVYELRSGASRGAIQSKLREKQNELMKQQSAALESHNRSVEDVNTVQAKFYKELKDPNSARASADKAQEEFNIATKKMVAAVYKLRVIHKAIRKLNNQVLAHNTLSYGDAPVVVEIASYGDAEETEDESDAEPEAPGRSTGMDAALFFGLL